MGFEKFSKSYFGSNYEKAKRNYELGVSREKFSFQRKYPSANVKNFVFDADLSKDGNLIRTFTRYRDEDGSLPEITSYIFKTFMRTPYIGNLDYGALTESFNLSF